MSHSVVLVRYADDMVLLARTESEARQAWERLQSQFATLRLVVNQEKSRLTTVEEGFAFLGFEFRKPPRGLLYMWPRRKACQHIRDRVREVVRSFSSSASIGEVIRKLHPILKWVVYLLQGRQQQPGLFISSTGPCRASCSYGSDANTKAVGGRLGSTGTMSSCISGVGCTKW